MGESLQLQRSSGCLQIRVLGHTEVICKGRTVALPPKQRALLAALVLEAGRMVTIDRLVDVLWGARPPASAVAKVQTHVSALRRVLGQRHVGSGPLHTHSTGYQLKIDSPWLDLAYFDELSSQAGRDAAEGRYDSASQGYTRALQLWRGRPFGDVDSAAIEAAAASLEERRLLAVESKAEIDLALGKEATAIADVSACLAVHPWRERLWGTLMLALYRRGCRADALKAYRDARRAMVDELGLEPCWELRRLHDAILMEESSLLSGSYPMRWSGSAT